MLKCNQNLLDFEVQNFRTCKKRNVADQTVPTGPEPADLTGPSQNYPAVQMLKQTGLFGTFLRAEPELSGFDERLPPAGRTGFGPPQIPEQV